MTFIQARNYRAGGNLPIDRIVIHDMESAEGFSTAEDVARWFAGSNAPMASAHKCFDADSMVECVHEQDTAFHAPPNAHSLGNELAGKASQSRGDWLDPYGIKMLALVATSVAEQCKVHNVPVVKLNASDLLAGRRGICGHADVSAAWHQTSHTDPGSNFPWDYFMKLVQDASNPSTGELTVAQYDALVTAIKNAEVLNAKRYVALANMAHNNGLAIQGLSAKLHGDEDLDAKRYQVLANHDASQSAELQALEKADQDFQAQLAELVTKA